MPMPPSFGHNSGISEGSLQYQMDVDEILADVERVIRGQFQVNGEWKQARGMEPMINEKGINAILMLLRSRLTKIFILSDFDEEQISRMTISVGRNIVDDFSHNWNKYELRDTAAASYILQIVCDTTYATLRKAKSGNYMKLLRQMHTIQEVQNVSQRPQQQESGLNPLNFLFKRRGR
jgi:hypothetical protein